MREWLYHVFVSVLSLFINIQLPTHVFVSVLSEINGHVKCNDRCFDFFHNFLLSKNQ